jgi:hypothetical protein
MLVSCSGGKKTDLASGEIFEYLPGACSSIIVLPQHERVMRKIFSLAVYFFGEEAITELKRTLIKNLQNETGLDLLSPAALKKCGFATNQPIVFANDNKNGYYLSLPLLDAPLAEKFMMRYVGNFTNAGEVRIAGGNDLRAILSENRLYVFSGVGIPEASAKAEEKPAALPLLQGLDTSSLIANAALDNSSFASLFPKGVLQPGRSVVRLTSDRDLISVDIQSSSTLFNISALFEGSLPFPLVSGGSLEGTGVHPFISLQDIAACTLNVDFNAIWQRGLRASLYAQIEQNTKGIDANPLTRLLSGGKPMAEVVMGMLDIERSVLGALTGRTAIVLRSLEDFSPLARMNIRMLQNLDGALVLETKGTDNARGLMQHLLGLSALPTGNELEIQAEEATGAELISFKAARKYGIPVIYAARTGRLILIGVNRESVVALVRQGEKRGDLVQLFGELGAFRIDSSASDFSVRISLAALYSGITGSLDEGTKQNLESFSAQIKKMQSISALRTRNPEAGYDILCSLRLASVPEPADPFENKAGESDSLLIILGIVLIAVFALPLLALLVRRIRHR